MKEKNKTIEDFVLINQTNIPDELISDLTSAFKEQKGWPKSCHERCLDVIEKWLKIDDSKNMREILFLKILVSGFHETTISNHYQSLFLLPIKDFLNDSHRATIWGNLSHLIKQSRSKNVYSFSSLVQRLVNDKDLKYKVWKKLIINHCIKNEKSDFLSLLYLIDKKIFKIQHLENLLESKKLSSFYNNAFENINWPLKYNKKIEGIIAKILVNHENNIKSLKNTQWLIDNYAEAENLGNKFLPLINTLSKEKQNHFINIKNKLLMNKLEHEIKFKLTSKIQMKI